MSAGRLMARVSSLISFAELFIAGRRHHETIVNGFEKVTPRLLNRKSRIIFLEEKKETLLTQPMASAEFYEEVATFMDSPEIVCVMLTLGIVDVTTPRRDPPANKLVVAFLPLVEAFWCKAERGDTYCIVSAFMQSRRVVRRRWLAPDGPGLLLTSL